jgi:hypothetical protein
VTRVKRLLVTFVAIGWLVGALFALDSGLRASKPEVKKEIVAVIEAQLTAFRKGDVAKAYTFSSARLRAQRSLASFAAVVKQYYPEIWSNTSAEYGLARDDGEVATLLVHVIGKQGQLSYDYRLIKERSGWRILGVLPHEPRPGEQL